MVLITTIVHIVSALIHIHITLCQQYDYPNSNSPDNMAPPMNRPSGEHYRPDRRRPMRPTSPKLPTCREKTCQNGGTCMETSNSLNPLVCKCHTPYFGVQCELLTKSPDQVELVEQGYHYLRVTWTPPAVINTPIYGYIVQHHEFGKKSAVTRSGLIHPNANEYIINHLEEDTKYTVCIKIVFDNTSIPDAVLRNQCLEVKTLPKTMESLIFILIICGAFVLIMLTLFILVVCFTRKRQERTKDDEIGSYPSMSWRRTQERGSYRDQSFLTENERNEELQFNDDSFHQNQTNNASRDEYCHGNDDDDDDDDDVFLTQSNKPMYMNQHQFAVRSSSVCEATRGGQPSDQKDSRLHSTSLATFDSRHTRKNSVPHANYRELPPSISNHMMRSPTARDKDASGDFDMGGSYFIRRS